MEDQTITPPLSAEDWKKVFSPVPENSIIVTPSGDGGWHAARKDDPTIAQGRTVKQAITNLECLESGGSCGIGIDWEK